MRTGQIVDISDMAKCVFAICMIISVICIVINLLCMALHTGTPFNTMYKTMSYQEYLLKNPGSILVVNNETLSPYVNKTHLSAPAVVSITPVGGPRYEVFLGDYNRTELIGNKLIVDLDKT